MVIAYVTPEYPDGRMRSGGIGTSISHLAKGLTAKGHTVFVIIFGAQQNESLVGEDGIRLIYTRNRVMRPFSFFLTSLKLQKLLNTLVRKEGLQLVEVPDWSGISALWRLNCPVVMRLNGSETYFAHLEQRAVRLSTRLLEQLAWKRCSKVISVSKYTGEVSSKLFKASKPFTTIPNAIDIATFTSAPVSGQGNVVLYYGSLVRKKGVLELPHIFNLVCRQFPAATLVIVGADASDKLTGNASTWQMMKAAFDARALPRVHYAGVKHYAEVKSFIQSAAVCVFPSFGEACPLSWLEAMAMQKAVVASNMPWAREIITHAVEGELIDPRQHEPFADAIVRLLQQPSLAKQYGLAARRKVEQQFDVHPVVSKMLGAYHGALINEAT